MMTKRMIAAVVGMTLLLSGAALAQSQSQCDQVRAAVAQHGYKAARAHAAATYGTNHVRAGEACLKRKGATKRKKGKAPKRR